MHPSPLALPAARQAVTRHCGLCDRYCWSADDPVFKQIPLVKSILNKALNYHLSVKNEQGLTLEYRQYQLSGDDITNAKKNQFLPLFPDVAIHYRCSDNLFGGMGLMSFGFLISLIPKGDTRESRLSGWGCVCDREEEGDYI